jgi:hypothetical protein
MPRIPRMIARDLIVYAKTLTLSGNFFDPRATSAYEFARQMRSPKLKKINPQFDCTLNQISTDDAPSLVAEFADGSKWTTETTDFTCERLRFDFFTRAGDAEDNLDSSPAESSGGKADAKGKGKK